MSGIEKSVDNLGRVVLPMKFRKKLGLTTDSKVLLSLTEDSISITPIEQRCALCEGKVPENQNLRICPKCVKKIKNSDL